MSARTNEISIRYPGKEGPFSSLVHPGSLLSKVMPRAVVQSFVDAAVGVIHRRYPELHGRMKDEGNFSFLVDPADLPFRFTLRFDGEAPCATVLDPAEGNVPADTVIRGSVSDLIGVFEGDADGDALFFSRDIVVEGNMEAALALRNAIENAEIDLAALLGPLGHAARASTRIFGSLREKAVRDLQSLRSSLLRPVEEECEKNRREIAELKRQIALLRARINRRDSAQTAAEGESR